MTTLSLITQESYLFNRYLFNKCVARYSKSLRTFFCGFLPQKKQIKSKFITQLITLINSRTSRKYD